MASSDPGSKVEESTEVTFTCNPGYILADNENKEVNLICQNTGNWNLNLPECIGTLFNIFF